jgi:hypothetical protein
MAMSRSSVRSRGGAGVRSRSESVERRSVRRRGGANPLASAPL